MTARAGFDLRALYDALDERRRERNLSWAAVAREMSRTGVDGHPIAAATLTRLQRTVVAEGDGVLQALAWLGRTPESFVPGFANPNEERFRLPEPGPDRILRWDTQALHAALDAQRTARHLTWTQIAEQIGGFAPSTLSRMSKAHRVGFPSVMRLVAWLGQPAVTFIRAAER
jgi:hypothetical protein